MHEHEPKSDIARTLIKMDTGYNDEHSQIGGDNGFSETQVVQSFGGRRRTRRACDRCNALRVRCDGQKPW